MVPGTGSLGMIRMWTKETLSHRCKEELEMKEADYELKERLDEKLKVSLILRVATRNQSEIQDSYDHISVSASGCQ